MENNNQELVDELIEKRWTMDDEEFEKKYESLTLDDKCKVSDAIYNMENEMMDDLYSEEYNDDYLSGVNLS